MVGTRKLDQLHDYVLGGDAKLVLVGDTRQLPEIDAGGLLRGLSRRLPTVTLEENRRQRHGWDRAALDELRSGDPHRFMDAYREQGRFVTGPNAASVRSQLIADWWATFSVDGTEAIMCAPRRADVDDLNRRARRRMADEGRLSGPALSVGARPFQVGDLVMTRVNDTRLGVRNGTRGWVVEVDPTQAALRVATLDGRSVTLGPEYLDRAVSGGRAALAHGYAATIHKTQGKTAERSFVLGDDSVYRELAYSAATRHRETATFYVVAARADERAELHGPDVPADPLAEFERALLRSTAKRLAIDHGRHHPDLASLSLAQLQGERATLRPSAVVPPELAEAPHRLALLERRHTSASAALARLEPNNTAAAERLHRELAALDRARPGLAARVAQLDGHREALAAVASRRLALDDAIDRRLGRVLRGIEARPPDYITAALGPRPGPWRDLRLWRQGAVAIEAYRQCWGVRDLGGAAHPVERALGPEPPAGAQRAHRARAGHEAREAWEGLHRSRALTRPGPTLERPGPG